MVRGFALAEYVGRIVAGQFSLDIARFNIKTFDQLNRVVRGISLRALRGFVLKTPVLTGRARGNWQVAIGGPANSYDWDLTDKEGAATIQKGNEILKGYKLGLVIFITNHIPYIIPLEYGHSRQHPAGMVRVTVAELGGQIVAPEDILGADVGMM